MSNATIECPHCRNVLASSQLVPGQQYSCPFCHGVFFLPVAVPLEVKSSPSQSQVAPLIDVGTAITKIHKFGIAHKPKETFQHALGGSFGAAFGWTLGKGLASFVVLFLIFGGCIFLAICGGILGEVNRSNESPAPKPVRRRLSSTQAGGASMLSQRTEVHF